MRNWGRKAKPKRFGFFVREVLKKTESLYKARKYLVDLRRKVLLSKKARRDLRGEK